jgi:hypothetical protein
MPTKTKSPVPEVTFKAPAKVAVASKTASKRRVKATDTTKASSNGKTKATPATSTGATAKKTAPAKKTAAKKSVPSKKTATATPVTAKKRAVAKKTAATETKAKGGQALPRTLNEHGFVIGSDSEKIVEILMQGGESRTELTAQITKLLSKGKGRNGEPPNVSSLIANVLRRLKDKGYTIEQHWQLMPPTPASKRAATRRAKAKEVEDDSAAVKDTKAVAKPKRRKVARKSTAA